MQLAPSHPLHCNIAMAPLLRAIAIISSKMLTLFTLAIAATIASARSIHFCGNNSLFSGDHVDLSPWPPVKGETVNVKLSGKLNNALHGGKYNLELVVNSDTLHFNGDLCTLFPTQCRQQSGYINSVFSFDVPHNIPDGEFAIKFEAFDNLENSVLCLKSNVNFHSDLFIVTNAKSVHDKQIIDSVNALNSTWRAGVSSRFFLSDMNEVSRLCGTIAGGPVLPLKPFVTLPENDIPESFDSRTKWGSTCPSLHEIRDQGNCGSCWAVAASAAMTDRLCIQSNGALKVRLSSQDMVSCCGYSCGYGCNGGYPSAAWSYFASTGLVSGGPWHSNEGCYPYEIAPCEHHVNGTRPACAGESQTPTCTSSCINGADYTSDKHKGVSSYAVDSSVAAIQSEIMQNGPVEASFTVYADFPSYRSGVYQHVSGSELGGHAVKMVGWGVENNVPYWLIANSWNSDWGADGLFKIIRGQDECGIESGVVAGLAH
jgi:cathepsin B